jgi:hypothetical protein
MKPNKQKIVSDILLYLEEGKGFEETFKLILTKLDLSRTTFSNYWKLANSEYSKTLEDRKRIFDTKTTESYIESVENGLMTKNDKLRTLEGIIKRETSFDKVFIIENVQTVVKILPDITAVLKAIEVHNKMTGDNEPEKVLTNIRLGKELEDIYE